MHPLSNVHRATRPQTAILALLAIFLLLGGCTTAIDPTQEDSPWDDRPWDDRPWADFLGQYVTVDDEGIHRVAYGAVTRGDRQRLEDYLDDLQAIAVSTLDRDRAMAFWINLYNALTVRVILDHHPVASILDVDLTPPADGPWDAELVTVEGRELSLNDIEHRILRPTWGDPRIHYAVNCASVGCPNLAREPFTAEGLEEQLDRAARAYVNHPRGARFEGGRLVVSSLYVWYREDFGGSDAGVVEHLRQYATGELAAGLAGYAGGLADGYDWSLNGAR